jgi:hypothetical protein
VNKYVNIDMPRNELQKLSLAHQSDLIRLALLSEYGGIWADATTYCMKPLDEWLEKYMGSGFFAFYRPGEDRLISNWFLSAEKGSPIITKLYDRMIAFWINNNFNVSAKKQKKRIKKLSKILNRSEKTTKYWFNPVITKIIRVYPYFVFHYMFERLVSVDPESKIIWQNTKKFSAHDAHIIKRHGLLSPPTKKIKSQINANQQPIYKLNWKYDHQKYTENTSLFYLLEGRKRNNEQY